MFSSRKIIAEFIGVFLFGAAAGALAFWSYTDTQLSSFMSNTSNAETLQARIEKKYADQYHLTPDEQARIKPLTTEMAQHIYKVRHQFGVDVIATLDDYHAQIAAQLTPEHRAAYEASMAARKKALGPLLLPDESSPTPGQK
jgi:hypothetical protein